MAATRGLPDIGGGRSSRRSLQSSDKRRRFGAPQKRVCLRGRSVPRAAARRAPSHRAHPARCFARVGLGRVLTHEFLPLSESLQRQLGRALSALAQPRETLGKRAGGKSFAATGEAAARVALLPIRRAPCTPSAPLRWRRGDETLQIASRSFGPLR
jgi:hypothetical protein